MEDKKDTRFQTQFHDEDFIGAMATDGLYTAGFLAGVVGCSAKTAGFYLKKLAAAGRINAVAVDEGRSTLYQLKKRRTKKEE